MSKNSGLKIVSVLIFISMFSGCAPRQYLRLLPNLPYQAALEEKVIEDGDMAKSYVKTVLGFADNYKKYVSNVEKYLKDEHAFNHPAYPEFYSLPGGKILYEKNYGKGRVVVGGGMPGAVGESDIYLLDIEKGQKYMINKYKIPTRNWETYPQIRFKIPFCTALAKLDYWEKGWDIYSPVIPIIKKFVYKDVNENLFSYDLENGETAQVNPPETKVLKWQIVDENLYFELKKEQIFIFVYSLTTGGTSKIETGPRQDFWKVSINGKILIFHNKDKWFYINLEKRPFSVKGPILETPEKTSKTRIKTKTKTLGVLAAEFVGDKLGLYKQDICGYFFIRDDLFVLVTAESRSSTNHLTGTVTEEIFNNCYTYNFKTEKLKLIDTEDGVLELTDNSYEEIKIKLKIPEYYIEYTDSDGNLQKLGNVSIRLAPSRKRCVFSLPKKVKSGLLKGSLDYEIFVGKVIDKKVSDVIQITSREQGSDLCPVFSWEGDYIFYLSSRDKFWNIYKTKFENGERNHAATKKGEDNQKLTVTDKKALKSKYFNEATSLYQQGKYKEAIAEWEEVLKLDPEHSLSKEKIEKTNEKIKNEKPK